MGKYIQKFTGLFLVAFLFTISLVIAQAPLGFNYQGVALTNAGNNLNLQSLSTGVYVIKVYSSDMKFVHMFKIVKL